LESVRDILSARGYSSVNDLDVNDRIEIDLDSEAQMPLTIEKIGEYEDGDVRGSRLSVAHYYTQRGDLMSDPEVVFDAPHDDEGEWVPVRYVQHPHLEQYDLDGLGADVQEFVAMWDENLRRQGYVDAAHAEGDTR
jgi:hypothetical protein